MDRRGRSREIADWRYQIQRASRNNVFCHCRDCDYEWVTSIEGQSCPNCNRKNIETILCWQFPDG